LGGKSAGGVFRDDTPIVLPDGTVLPGVPGSGVNSGGGSSAFEFPPEEQEEPFYKKPLTYAVAGGAALALLGGVLLFKQK
jgi:hypothetical protein